MTTSIAVGDHVYVGKGKVHWVVTSIRRVGGVGRAVARLKSGQTGRYRTAWVDELTIHTKGEDVARSE